MKVFRGIVGLIGLICIAVMVIALLVNMGCQPVVPPGPGPGPGPKPEPQPTPAGVTILVFHDPADKADLQLYADPTFDKFVDSKGHSLRIHPINVVDETGKTPKYLEPYLAYFVEKNLKSPSVLLAAKGKVRGHLEQPSDIQAIMAYLDKSLGETVPEDGYFAGGQWRKLSSLKPCKPGVEKRWTLEGAEANEPLIPREKWQTRDLTPYLWGIKDQGQRSSCAPTSLATIDELIGARTGLKKFLTSPLDVYWQVNGNSDSGATLEDCAAVISQKGICTAEFCPEQGVRKPNYKSGYELSRAKHRLTHVTYCQGVDAIGSAIQRHKLVHIGLLVDSGFSPNADGIIGPKRGRSGGGHALAAVGVRIIDGQVYLLLVNSWSENWGGSRDGKLPKGCCWIHESWIEPVFGAFAYGAIVSPSDDPIQ